MLAASWPCRRPAWRSCGPPTPLLDVQGRVKVVGWVAEVQRRSLERLLCRCATWIRGRRVERRVLLTCTGGRRAALPVRSYRRLQGFNWAAAQHRRKSSLKTDFDAALTRRVVWLCLLAAAGAHGLRRATCVVGLASGCRSHKCRRVTCKKPSVGGPDRLRLPGRVRTTASR